MEANLKINTIFSEKAKDVIFIILILVLFWRIYVLMEDINQYTVSANNRATYASVEDETNRHKTCYFAFSEHGNYVYTDTPARKNYEGTYRKNDERSYIINGTDISGSVIFLGKEMYFYNKKNNTLKKFIKISNAMIIPSYEDELINETN